MLAVGRVRYVYPVDGLRKERDKLLIDGRTNPKRAADAFMIWKGSLGGVLTFWVAGFDGYTKDAIPGGRSE